jgi:hypothetical protein
MKISAREADPKAFSLLLLPLLLLLRFSLELLLAVGPAVDPGRPAQGNVEVSKPNAVRAGAVDEDAEDSARRVVRGGAEGLHVVEGGPVREAKEEVVARIQSRLVRGRAQVNLCHLEGLLLAPAALAEGADVVPCDRAAERGPGTGEVKGELDRPSRSRLGVEHVDGQGRPASLGRVCDQRFELRVASREGRAVDGVKEVEERDESHRAGCWAGCEDSVACTKGWG